MNIKVALILLSLFFCISCHHWDKNDGADSQSIVKDSTLTLIDEDAALSCFGIKLGNSVDSIFRGVWLPTDESHHYWFRGENDLCSFPFSPITDLDEWGESASFYSYFDELYTLCGFREKYRAAKMETIPSKYWYAKRDRVARIAKDKGLDMLSALAYCEAHPDKYIESLDREWQKKRFVYTYYRYPQSPTKCCVQKFKYERFQFCFFDVQFNEGTAYCILVIKDEIVQLVSFYYSETEEKMNRLLEAYAEKYGIDINSQNDSLNWRTIQFKNQEIRLLWNNYGDLYREERNDSFIPKWPFLGDLKQTKYVKVTYSQKGFEQELMELVKDKRNKAAEAKKQAELFEQSRWDSIARAQNHYKDSVYKAVKQRVTKDI